MRTKVDEVPLAPLEEVLERQPVPGWVSMVLLGMAAEHGATTRLRATHIWKWWSRIRSLETTIVALFRIVPATPEFDHNPR